MPNPIAKLGITHSVRLPGEPFAFQLLLRNPTPEDLPVSLPATCWWAGARFELVRPDRSRSEFLLDGNAINDGPDLEIFEEAELAAPFSLEGRITGLTLPGEYELSGVLPTREGAIAIAPVRWLVEDTAPMEAFVAPMSQVDRIEDLSYWTLLRGEKRAALYRGGLSVAEDAARERIATSGMEHVADVGRLARGLVGMEFPGDPLPPRNRWLAWLEGDVFHAGVPFALFNSTSVELPGRPGRILPNLVAEADAGAAAWVLSETGDVLWVVRLRAPEEVTPAASEDDDYFPDPRDLVRVPAPDVSSMPLPAAFTHGSAARWKGITAVALLERSRETLDVHYGIVEENSVVWGAARIDHAEPMEGADPAIALDDRGIGRVAVLFRSGRSIGVATLAFDREAKPIWSSGIRRELYGSVDQSCRGAISLQLDPATGRWVTSWAVEQDDGSVLFPDGNGGFRTAQRNGHQLVRPALAVWPERWGIGYQSEEGQLRFCTADDW